LFHLKSVQIENCLKSVFCLKEKKSKKEAETGKEKKKKKQKTSSKWAGPFGLQRREEGTRRLVPDAKGVK
jgi:hypothetical protein